VITNGQGTAGATAARLCPIPPGPASLLLSNLGTASPVYVGAGTNLSTTNGFPVPSGVVPVVIPLYAGGQAQTLYAVTASGAASIGWIVTSPTGGTGTGSLD
jgi:hypothetical protein